MIRSFVKNRLAVACFVSSIYLLLVFFFYHINKYLSEIFYFIAVILIVLSFLFITIGFIIGFFRILYGIRNIKIKDCLPTILYAIPLWYTLLCPYSISSAPSERNVVLRACFEGTQNQATLKFYRDNSFDLHWSGVFGYSEYFYGTYSQQGDTLLLKYKSACPVRFGQKILNDGKSLISIDSSADNSFVPFYLGYCQGLN
jgi:hypothetical protein